MRSQVNMMQNNMPHHHTIFFKIFHLFSFFSKIMESQFLIFTCRDFFFNSIFFKKQILMSFAMIHIHTLHLYEIH
jgi:hypothetical protein